MGCDSGKAGQFCISVALLMAFGLYNMWNCVENVFFHIAALIQLSVIGVTEMEGGFTFTSPVFSALSPPMDFPVLSCIPALEFM